MPHISPSGGVGITGSGTSTIKIIELDSKRYSNFVKTAMDFQNQRVSGKHPHITEFNFGENFHYQSDVYEVKDRCFDAIDIGYSHGLLTVYLTDPGVVMRNKIPRKLWRRVKQLDLNLFLSGSQHIDRYINELNWKKDYVGIIIHDNVVYNILNQSLEPESKEEQTDGNDNYDDRYLAMPNFLTDDGIYSVPNFLSYKFEDVTGDYLTDYLSKSGNYPVIKKRQKPSYLNEKEIDIIAEQKAKGSILMIICECKFRRSLIIVFECFA